MKPCNPFVSFALLIDPPTGAVNVVRGMVTALERRTETALFEWSPQARSSLKMRRRMPWSRLAREPGDAARLVGLHLAGLPEYRETYASAPPVVLPGRPADEIIDRLAAGGFPIRENPPSSHDGRTDKGTPAGVAS